MFSFVPYCQYIFYEEEVLSIIKLYFCACAISDMRTVYTVELHKLNKVMHDLIRLWEDFFVIFAENPKGFFKLWLRP